MCLFIYVSLESGSYCVAKVGPEFLASSTSPPHLSSKPGTTGSNPRLPISDPVTQNVRARIEVRGNAYSSPFCNQETEITTG